MAWKGKSFSIDAKIEDQIVNRIMGLAGWADEIMLKRVTAATNLVYATARARRPKVARQHTPVTGKWSKAYRVSDPQAAYGVPVKTGALKASIKKEIYQIGGKTIGHIYTELPYAPHVEYGHKIGKTSKTVAPRPFMRQALALNQKTIENLLTGKQ